MRVLVVAVDLETFVADQCNAVGKDGVHVFKFQINGHGIIGYAKSLWQLRKVINLCHPDLIHAHYGLSGLCANLQRKVPVVTTYHGSDIHSGGWILKISQLAINLSAYNIFISKKLKELSGTHGNNVSILPCGIDIEKIHEIPRDEAKRKMNRQYPFVLFSGAFTNDVKNPSLAKEAMGKVPEAELLELKGYNRKEVNLLMNAADCLLMTSLREGSPQVVKEAMACGTPVVSVDVGDVKEIMGDTKGCFLVERNADAIAEKIELALAFKGKTNGRQRIIELGLSNDLVAKKLIGVYNEVLRK